nr:hypothetical protein Iba_chr15eCG4490 [Ipomoea batatas]
MVPVDPLQRRPFQGPDRNTWVVSFLKTSCGYPVGLIQSLYSPFPGFFSDFHADKAVSRPSQPNSQNPIILQLDFGLIWNWKNYEGSVSIGNPDYSANGYLAVPYAKIDIVRRIGWAKKPHFKDSTRRNNGVTIFEGLSGANGIPCKRNLVN